jgi:Protein of unknown function (DUF4238)
MASGESHLHHYVPRWYQKRFLPVGQKALCYLDLKPDLIDNGNFKYKKKALRFWDPARCFCARDLYSLRFGNQTTDVLEKRLFGIVDKRGAAATEFFRHYDDLREGTHEAYQGLLAYLGAQRSRTPHGLDWLAKHMGLSDKNMALIAMQQLFQQYATMWMEGIWEIVHARLSPTKFIIGDVPVVFFNRNIVPGGYAYPGINDFPMTGTRTIFPLSDDSCLIITHLQLARNPWNRPTERRVNARAFQQTMANLTDIQFGRELEENEVLRINFILKGWARKYIAAADREFLYPEKHVENLDWTKLDHDWFLFPNLWKVGFTTGTFVGYKSGEAWGMDEYGRNPGQPGYQDEGRRSFEQVRIDEGKKEWARRRLGKSLARVVDQMREDTVSDRMMNRFLQEQGLLPGQPDEANSG